LSYCEENNLSEKEIGDILGDNYKFKKLLKAECVKLHIMKEG
jgi:hypothetical protein